MKKIIRHVLSIAALAIFLVIAWSSAIAIAFGINPWPVDKVECLDIDPPRNVTKNILITVIDPKTGLGVSGITVYTKILNYKIVINQDGDCIKMPDETREFTMSTKASGDLLLSTSYIQKDSYEYLVIESSIFDSDYYPNKQYSEIYLNSGFTKNFVFALTKIDEL